MEKLHSESHFFRILDLNFMHGISKTHIQYITNQTDFKNRSFKKPNKNFGDKKGEEVDM